jgi:anaphase-promoting complex subunit 1
MRCFSDRGFRTEAGPTRFQVHVPSLHPPSYPDLEVSSAVQTAAVLGIGLLYQVPLPDPTARNGL